jgi:hypothetical protein
MTVWFVYTKAFQAEEVLYQYRIQGTDAGSYFVKSLNIKPENLGLFHWSLVRSIK